MKPPLVFLVLLCACGPRPIRIPGPTGMVGTDPDDGYDVADEPRAPTQDRLPKGDRLGERLARSALEFQRRLPSRYRDDCSGLVEAVYDDNGYAVRGTVRTIWTDAEAHDAVHHRKRPNLGDLVFFDDTWDHDGDGRNDDPLTHMGIVVDVAADDTVSFVHGGTSNGRVVGHLNLRHPDVHRDGDRVLNDYLRSRSRRDRPGTRYLAGELFRAFATWRPPAIVGRLLDVPRMPATLASSERAHWRW